MSKAKVLGVERLKRKIRTGLPESMRQRTKAALLTSAEELTTLQKAVAPKLTGAGADAIGFRYVEDKRGQRVTIFAADPDTFYMRFVEFTPGKAFFYPPYRAGKRRYKGRTTRAVNKGIKEAVGL